MGTGIRVFLTNKAGSPQSFPRMRFERLYEPVWGDKRFGPKEGDLLKDRVDEWVCFAMVFLDLENRKPVKIGHLDYMRVKVDKNGAFDIEENRHAALPPPITSDRAKLAQWRGETRDGRWVPTEAQDKLIRAMSMRRGVLKLVR